jgi:DNA invertase Pin-like site-specific DNA recombinase
LEAFDTQVFENIDGRYLCEAYIRSQAGEGWRLVADRYDDGGLSGASLDRPALQALLAEVRARKLDVVVVYKVDRLTRSLADFAKLIELFDAHAVSFVSVTKLGSASGIAIVTKSRSSHSCYAATRC